MIIIMCYHGNHTTFVCIGRRKKHQTENIPAHVHSQTMKKCVCIIKNLIIIMLVFKCYG